MRDIAGRTWKSGDDVKELNGFRVGHGWKCLLDGIYLA